MPETIVARFLLKWMLVPVLLLWAYHLAQRRYAETVGAKRAATLYLTLLLLVAWVAIYAFVRLGLGDVFLLVPAAAVVAVAVWQRRKLFPYRTRCAQCSRPLGLERVHRHHRRLRLDSRRDIGRVGGRGRQLRHLEELRGGDVATAQPADEAHQQRRARVPVQRGSQLGVEHAALAHRQVLVEHRDRPALPRRRPGLRPTGTIGRFPPEEKGTG